MDEEKYPKYGHFVEAEGQLADELRFLAVAVSNDETRYFMKDIAVEEVEAATTDRPYPILRAIATDGRRMHIVEPLCESSAAIHGMTAGRYHVIAKGVKRVQVVRINYPAGAFPNWRNAVPSGEVVHTSEFTGIDLSGAHFGRGSGDLVKLLREFPAATGINLRYVADLGLGTAWKVAWWSAQKALRFVAGSKTALIMPVLVE